MRAVHLAEGLLNLRQDPQPLAIASTAGKCISLEVSREANARRDHDVGVFSGRVEPAYAAVWKQR